MNDSLSYIITSVLKIASFLFVARFLLQACRADFYNPISQSIVKITDPVLKPLRLILPGFKNMDFAAFLIACLIEILLVVALGSLRGQYVGSVMQLVVIGFMKALLLCIQIFWWSILINIVASFIAPGNNHPMLILMNQITEPLLGPARRLIPPMGGLDFSPILVFIVLGLLERMIPNILLSLIS